jgi:hypothetical protein
MAFLSLCSVCSLLTDFRTDSGFQGIIGVGLVVGVLLDPFEQFQRFPFLVGFGLVVRLARFPVNPESRR